MPVLIIDVLFLFFPFFYGFYLSFTTSMNNQTLTSANYAYVLSVYAPIMLTTVELAALITVILVVISLPIAYILAIKVKSDAIKNLVLLVALAPFWIDWNIRMIAWYPVFGANGFLSSIYVSILTGLGYSNVEPVSLLFTNASVIITWIQSLLLFMVVPIYLMMLRMDPIVLKAASTLRASTLKTFYYITLQWSLPGILIGSVFVFSLAMVDYATPLLVGGGLPTIGVIIWQLGSYYEWPQAMALSTLVLAIILVFVAITLRKVSITRILY
ncbi:MAG: ABC transporter permease [Candidatus Bathyarchaeia archaeon]